MNVRPFRPRSGSSTSSWPTSDSSSDRMLRWDGRSDYDVLQETLIHLQLVGRLDRVRLRAINAAIRQELDALYLAQIKTD